MDLVEFHKVVGCARFPENVAGKVYAADRLKTNECRGECLTRVNVEDSNGEDSTGAGPRRWLGLNEKGRFFKEVAGNDKA